MEKIEIEEQLLGIAVYEKKRDGCINGIWTHHGMKGVLWNEIAKKKDNKTKLSWAGEYHSIYFNEKYRAVEGDLTIQRDGKSYILEWKKEKVHTYYGIGIVWKKRYLIVSYYWNNKLKTKE